MSAPAETAGVARPTDAIVGIVIWILLHLYVAYGAFHGGYVPLGFLTYAGISCLVAIPLTAFVCKRSVAKFWLLVLWGVGSFLGYGYAKVGAAYYRHQFEEDMAEVRELCEKYGGEKIYRIVENVEGVFQMVARDPTRALLTDPNAENPWATAQGDRADIGGYVTSEGYRFFEQQPGYKETGPPFKRTYLQFEDQPAGLRSDGESGGLTTLERSVNKLRSRYGYVIEDLTTPEMRRRWIGGGMIRIVDIESDEVLAERTGFYKAIGGGVKLHWESVRASQDACKFQFGLLPFLKGVLKPVEEPPTAVELRPLSEE